MSSKNGNPAIPFKQFYSGYSLFESRKTSMQLVYIKSGSVNSNIISLVACQRLDCDKETSLEGFGIKENLQ